MDKAESIVVPTNKRKSLENIHPTNKRKSLENIHPTNKRKGLSEEKEEETTQTTSKNNDKGGEVLPVVVHAWPTTVNLPQAFSTPTAFGFRNFVVTKALSTEQRIDLWRAHEVNSGSITTLAKDTADDVKTLRTRLHKWLTPYECAMSNNNYFPHGLAGFYSI
jgi:hypothetical protein